MKNNRKKIEIENNNFEIIRWMKQNRYDIKCCELVTKPQNKNKKKERKKLKRKQKSHLNRRKQGWHWLWYVHTALSDEYLTSKRRRAAKNEAIFRTKISQWIEGTDAMRFESTLRARSPEYKHNFDCAQHSISIVVLMALFRFSHRFSIYDFANRPLTSSTLKLNWNFVAVPFFFFVFLFTDNVILHSKLFNILSIDLWRLRKVFTISFRCVKSLCFSPINKDVHIEARERKRSRERNEVRKKLFVLIQNWVTAQ